MCFLSAAGIIIAVAAALGVIITVFWEDSSTAESTLWLPPGLSELPPGLSAVLLAFLGILATVVVSRLFAPVAPEGGPPHQQPTQTAAVATRKKKTKKNDTKKAR